MEEDTQDEPTPAELIRRARTEMLADTTVDPRRRALAVTKLEEAALWWGAALNGGVIG